VIGAKTDGKRVMIIRREKVVVQNIKLSLPK
jgi:hypothetical protein